MKKKPYKKFDNIISSHYFDLIEYNETKDTNKIIDLMTELCREWRRSGRQIIDYKYIKDDGYKIILRIKDVVDKIGILKEGWIFRNFESTVRLYINGKRHKIKEFIYYL